MTIITRYLGREIYKATLFAFVVFLALFAFFDLINELDNLGKGTYRMPQAFLFVLLSIPGHVYELFPIAVLIGTLVALSNLANNSEFTVLRVSGFSPWRAGATLTRIGMVFVVATVLVGELAAPVAERAAQQLRLDSLGRTIAQELRTGLWVRADSKFVNIREVSPDSSLKGVQIYEFDDSMHLKSISQAAAGTHVGEKTWRLTDVTRTLFTNGGAHVERLASIDWQTVITPDMLAVLLVRPEKMSAWGLYQYTRHLAKNRQSTERYEIALWKKIIYPFAALVMMGLALPFAYILVRSGGVGAKLFAGIMLGVLFHFLNTLFSHLGVLQGWAPLASAVLPSAIFLLIAMGMMWWVERR